MIIFPKGFKGLTVVFLAFALCLIFSPRCLGEDSVWVASEAVSHQKISLVVGETTVIKSKSPHLIKRVSVGNPVITDAIIMSPTARGTYPQQISLIGKAPGITNLTLWGKDNEVFAVLDLEVSPDISRLKEKLHEILPEEKDIRVTATHDNITLSGTVSSTANLSQVLVMAESYAPKKVVNLVEVAGVHQVMLEVRVSEMSRSVMKRLGFNFNILRGADFGFSLLGGLTSDPTLTVGSEGVAVSPGINAIFRFHHNDATWTGFIDALKENGLIKVLAEPTLIALSGQPASFLAGGEYPIPVADKESVTIEYKSYGVGLTFTPTVLNTGKISMKVAPEVSELDYSNAVYLYGYLVPALTTRRASTTVEMADGQSFAIAGLIKESTRDVVSKFPLLGDIPILGALFRSTKFQKNESELVIIVTPHLVKPLDMARQTLPTDRYIEPDDFEFYLLGAMEGRERSPLLKKEGGMEGEFGHIIP